MNTSSLPNLGDDFTVGGLPELTKISCGTLSTFFAFTAALNQPTGSVSRFLCLPLVLAAPVYYFTDIIYGLHSSLVNWIWTFTILIWSFHAVSVLYFDHWVIPRPAQGWNWHAARKAFNNPRRIPQPQQPSTKSRIRFVMGSILAVLFSGLAWIALLGVGLFYLKTRPRDFDPPSYLFPLEYQKPRFIRAAFIRAFAVTQWIIGCYTLLLTGHTLGIILFVGILRADEPEEWPPLWGDIREAYTVRRFWAKFWQRIGTPSQVSFGKAFSRLIGVKQNTQASKVLTALCVFLLSGGIHIMTNWALLEDAPKKSKPGSAGYMALQRDAVFLMLNFAAGLTEVLANKISGVLIPPSVGMKYSKELAMGKRLLGYAWVFFFFCCVIPPYQYPYLYETMTGFIPDIRFNIQRTRPLP